LESPPPLFHLPPHVPSLLPYFPLAYVFSLFFQLEDHVVSSALSFSAQCTTKPPPERTLRFLCAPPQIKDGSCFLLRCPLLSLSPSAVGRWRYSPFSPPGRFGVEKDTSVPSDFLLASNADRVIFPGHPTPPAGDDMREFSSLFPFVARFFPWSPGPRSFLLYHPTVVILIRGSFIFVGLSFLFCLSATNLTARPYCPRQPWR